MNFDHAIRGEDRIWAASLCQIFEWPTQRLLISCTIETEVRKAHKPEARSPCCAVGHTNVGELHGRALVALVYEIKTCEIFYSVGFLARYTKICTNENFPLYGSL